MMSHEFRTPLNGVIGMAELLAASGGVKQVMKTSPSGEWVVAEKKGVCEVPVGPPLSPEQLEYVTTIRRSGDSLLRIVNDILGVDPFQMNMCASLMCFFCYDRFLQGGSGRTLSCEHTLLVRGDRHRYLSLFRNPLRVALHSSLFCNPPRVSECLTFLSLLFLCNPLFVVGVSEAVAEQARTQETRVTLHVAKDVPVSLVGDPSRIRQVPSFLVEISSQEPIWMDRSCSTLWATP